MAERFEAWDRRYRSTSPAALERRGRARSLAERLERDVCAAAGVRPSDVARLRWVGPAIRLAKVGPR
jgi:hypothetical protein